MGGSLGTMTASGSSTQTSTLAAATEATRRALADLGKRTPAFGFLFCSPGHDLTVALTAVRQTAPGTDVLGCTTAGELTEQGLTHGGVAVLLVAPTGFSHQVAFSRGMAAGPDGVAAALGRGFRDAKQKALQVRHVHSTTVVLTDGLSGAGEKMIEALRHSTDVFQQIVGGAAGDEGAFKETRVGAAQDDSAQADADAAVALHVFGNRAWGVGVGHGLEPNSERLRVTRAKGNVVYEIDQKPAFAAYQAHAGRRGVKLQPDTAGPYLIGNELGIFRFGELIRARAPLGVGADGSLTCAADVPEGSAVCILNGEPKKMVAAARRAAEEAKTNLEGGEAAGVLLFDCVCRGMILDRRFDEEIEAVRSVFGDVPVAGFLTYGEIAQYRGTNDGWHNATAVVLAIPT